MYVSHLNSGLITLNGLPPPRRCIFLSHVALRPLHPPGGGVTTVEEFNHGECRNRIEGRMAGTEGNCEENLRLFRIRRP